MQGQTDILLKVIEGLNSTIANLSADHKKEVDSLNQRIKELTAQVAYLNRQLFGRKAEKLPIYDPNYPDMFADQFADIMQQAEEKRDEAVEVISKQTKEDKKQKRQNRVMLENLPVLKQTILNPDYLDNELYKETGREVTSMVEHQPGKLYIHELIRI